LTRAAGISARLVQKALELDANAPSTEQREEEGDQKHGKEELKEVCEEKIELRVHFLTYKKAMDVKITDKDICHLSFGHMMPVKQVLLKAVSSLLKKTVLNELELCAIELSLSSIFNKVNPAIGEAVHYQVINLASPTSTPSNQRASVKSPLV
jgi:hypothetical protein